MPVNQFYFVLYMLIDMASHVRTVKAILSIACHLPNPFTNEYQSEDRDNFLSFFQWTKRRRMWSLVSHV